MSYIQYSLWACQEAKGSRILQHQSLGNEVRCKQDFLPVESTLFTSTWYCYLAPVVKECAILLNLPQNYYLKLLLSAWNSPLRENCDNRIRTRKANKNSSAFSERTIITCVMEGKHRTLKKITWYHFLPHLTPEWFTALVVCLSILQSQRSVASSFCVCALRRLAR